MLQIQQRDQPRCLWTDTPSCGRHLMRMTASWYQGSASRRAKGCELELRFSFLQSAIRYPWIAVTASGGYAMSLRFYAFEELVEPSFSYVERVSSVSFFGHAMSLTFYAIEELVEPAFSYVERISSVSFLEHAKMRLDVGSVWSKGKRIPHSRVLLHIESAMWCRFRYVLLHQSIGISGYHDLIWRKSRTLEGQFWTLYWP